MGSLGVGQLGSRCLVFCRHHLPWPSPTTGPSRLSSSTYVLRPHRPHFFHLLLLSSRELGSCRLLSTATTAATHTRAFSTLTILHAGLLRSASSSSSFPPQPRRHHYCQSSSAPRLHSDCHHHRRRLMPSTNACRFELFVSHQKRRCSRLSQFGIARLGATTFVTLLVNVTREASTIPPHIQIQQSSSSISHQSI